MSDVQIYDRALCCSSGICGPEIDPVLARFAADLDWLKQQQHTVVRFNLAYDAAQFAANPVVQTMLADAGTECLPLVVVDGQVVSRSEYPTRENLSLWTRTPLKTMSALPVAGSGCCGDSGCC